MKTNFIQYINNLVKESDLTKEDFIEYIRPKIDKNRATIFNYLNGKTPATIEFLEAALEIFGAKITISFGEDKDKSISYEINFHKKVTGKVHNAPKTQFINGAKISINEDDELVSELQATEEKIELLEKQLSDKDVLIEELRDDKKLLKQQVNNLWEQLQNSKS